MNKKILILQRFISNNKLTAGILKDGDNILCYTLENPNLNNQKKISCIPEGEYNVIFYSSPKYPKAFQICNVPDRDAILIHNGNYVKHTKGCILVGEKWYSEKEMITSSVATLQNLINIYPNGFILKIIYKENE